MTTKVLQIIWSYGNGGMENIARNLTYTKNKNFSNHLCIINNDIDSEAARDLEKRNLILINRKRGSANYLKFILFFYHIFKLKPDIIHIHSCNLVNLIYPLKKILGFKIVTTIHGMHDFDKSIEKSDVVVCVSNTQLKLMKKNILDNKINIKKLISINNGIRMYAKNELKGFDKELKIVIVGRLNHHQKRQDFILDAFRKIIDLDFDASLTIIGSGDSKKFLQEKCKKLKLSDKVYFWGSVNNKKLIKSLQEFDIMISASKEETFGLNIIEALSVGLTVAAYPALSIKEISKDTKIVHFYKSEDELIKIIKDIKKISDRDRLLSQNIIRERYQLKNMVKKYHKIYRQKNGK
tara:strand:+ start:1772 stop:2824 length:1053 start_codon:yes stop_codon:yes gene_type:complete